MNIFLRSPNFLETVAAETEKNNDAAVKVTAGLSEAQLNWKASPERWSIRNVSII